MSLTYAPRLALRFLVLISILSSTYLYFYPVFHFCAFPSSEANVGSEYMNTLRYHLSYPVSPNDQNKIAPFRLLVLGDPQLEGDSSIGDIQATSFPNLKSFLTHLQQNKSIFPLKTLRLCLHDLVDFYLDDIPKSLKVWHKRLDHIGNDYFLGHIYKTLHWWTNPTHVTVLGDLIGSQWVDDEEFENRGRRFWNRVFKGGMKVAENLVSTSSNGEPQKMVLGEDGENWARRIINIVGNHDIGYAGDMSSARLERFTKVFGKYNYELRFEAPVKKSSSQPVDTKSHVPELRIIILNNLNLDVPTGSTELQQETYSFLNSIIASSPEVGRSAHFTLVLTHIPLFKREGICNDGPLFRYYDGEYQNGVKEQYLLSQDASKNILEGIFGKSGKTDVPGEGFGRNGAILNGHDHEGCDVLHYINQSMSHEAQWNATRWDSPLSHSIRRGSRLPTLREITTRSMMGAYDGNAGLMSLWFDETTWDWKFEFTNCRFGKQHIWWVIHVLDLITSCTLVWYGIHNLTKRFPRTSLRLASNPKDNTQT
ncbi:Protein TED1 [Golovinomyces cichoracearum]|uniref:Protein TED1 n=1 Tax=Golovinomyces cichoracearum TaxID=62708 RepID=A0A420HCK6_9PEZI|nr:Protein TED1 [Golovinomyces cichoracearum]